MNGLAPRCRLIFSKICSKLIGGSAHPITSGSFSFSLPFDAYLGLECVQFSFSSGFIGLNTHIWTESWFTTHIQRILCAYSSIFGSLHTHFMLYVCILWALFHISHTFQAFDGLLELQVGLLRWCYCGSCGIIGSFCPRQLILSFWCALQVGRYLWADYSYRFVSSFIHLYWFSFINS